MRFASGTLRHFKKYMIKLEAYSLSDFQLQELDGIFRAVPIDRSGFKFTPP